MPQLNKILAVIVLAVAAAWVFFGEFSWVGSEMEEHGKANATTTAESEGVAAEPEAESEPVVTAPRKVRVSEISAVDYSRKIRISGTTEANKRVVLAARSNGMVREVLVTEGEVVGDGTVLVQLDIEGRDLSLNTAKQLLSQRQADAEAYKRLLDSGDLPELQFNAAMTALREAEGQVEMARLELDRTRVSAPFSGVLNSVDAEVGTWLSQGSPVATLLQLDPLIATVEVNENTLGSIRTGDEASVALATGDVVTGKIRFISREASQATRTYRVEVEIANPDNLIPSGMSAEIEMLSQPVRAVIQPRSVVLLNDDGELGVRTLGPGNVVEFHAVTIIDDTSEGLVLQGVPENMPIIVQGQNLVLDGDTVEPVAAEAGAGQ